MINTFIFDIGNVLLDFDYMAVYRALFDEQTAQAVADATVRRPELWAELDQGVLPYEDVVNAMVQDAPELAREIPYAVEELYRRVLPFPYATPWLKRLKELGYRVYILSNFGQIPYLHCIPRMDFLEYTDGGVISYEIKALKPDRAIFEALCRRYPILPEEAVFLDDSPVNIGGAAEFGLHTVCFRDPAQAAQCLAALPLAYGL